MLGQTELQPWFTLMSGVLSIISSRERRIMLIATLISKHTEEAGKCLSINEYVQITKAPAEEVREHVRILCEANLLKPVKCNIYDITEFGRFTLNAIGVTGNLIEQYRTKGMAFKA